MSVIANSQSSTRGIRAGTPSVQKPVAPAVERALAGFVAAGCLAVLVVAAGLVASERGHGTHEQLGLPTCGWILAAGVPCPTCGMTTAFASAAAGDWLASARAQPMGTILALAAAAAFWIALHVAVFGSRAGRVCGRLLRPRYLAIIAGVWAISWGYKVLVMSTNGVVLQ